MDTLYLCGAGNAEGVRLALRVNEMQARWHRIVLLDDDPEIHGKGILGVPIEGPFSLLKDVDPACSAVVNLVARTTAGRHAARQKIAGFGVSFASLISGDVDTLGADIRGDVTVYPNATIGPGTTLGPGSVVFMGAVVGHGSRVGAGCVLAANSVLNARVELDDYVYVGTNSTILPEIRIGEGATVGAGSSVIRDVPGGATVLGVPARVLAASDAPREASNIHADDPADPRAVKQAEQIVCEVWRRVLDLDEVDRGENFFDLGGTSLRALQAQEALHDITGVDLGPIALFRYPTVESLARRLTIPQQPGSRPSGGPSIPVVPKAPPAPSFEGELVPVVLEVFESVLQADGVGPDQHFFDSGGGSTQAHEACEQLQRRTGYALCHMHIARYPTPRRLAEFMATLSAGGAPPCPARGTMQRLIHRERRSIGETH